MEYRTFPEIAAQSFATNSICYNHEIEKKTMYQKFYV